MSQCLSIGTPVLVCVCRGSPISGSFPTLLPSAFLILVELRPEAYSSPVQHCQKICVCARGWGIGGSSSPWGPIAFTVVCGLPCLCQWRRRGSKLDQPETAGLILGPKGDGKHHVLCCQLRPQTFTLVWRRRLGKGVAGLVKRTRATGAKVGTFEARWGSPAASELGLESALTPATVRGSVEVGTQPL